MWPLTANTPESAGPETELVRRCVAGDRSALDTLYRAHVDAISRTLYRLVGPAADLEDLVQSTFIEAINALPRFRGAASLRTWLTRIAIHEAQRYLRAGRVRRHVSLEVVPEADEPEVPDSFLPGAGLDERRLSSRLHGLLDQIAPKKRTAFLLFAIEGRPVEEVAAVMGATQTATRSRVFFARRELRALIEADPALASLSESLLGERSRQGSP